MFEYVEGENCVEALLVSFLADFLCRSKHDIRREGQADRIR
jgi:hypothetical protein